MGILEIEGFHWVFQTVSPAEVFFILFLYLGLEIYDRFARTGAPCCTGQE